MMERIKRRILSIGNGAKKAPEIQPVLRGRTHNVIVVKPKNEIFTQAIFIMRDDYFSSSALPQDELLDKARRAAGIYVPAVSGIGAGSRLMLCILSILLAAETACIFIIL